MRRIFSLSLLSAVAAAAAAAPVPLAAQGDLVSSAIEFADRADALEPGQWVWAPDIARDGPVTVFVDLTEQVATVYRDGVRIGVTTVSTGRPGHETPTGVFVILEKDADHHSNLYNNASMPFTQRLTWGGVALHAGGLPGYPESHGCVHLPLEFAHRLFDITEMGGTVIIGGQAGSSIRTHGGGILAAHTPSDTLPHHVIIEGDVEYEWEPEASPSGPVAIVASLTDQVVVVMRNGVEIGRAPASFPHDDFASHVLTLTEGVDGEDHWLYLNVPGHADESVNNLLDAAVAERIRMPEGFIHELRGILEPGVTMFITRASVGKDTSGHRITVLNGVEEGHGGS